MGEQITAKKEVTDELCIKGTSEPENSHIPELPGEQRSRRRRRKETSSSGLKGQVGTQVWGGLSLQESHTQGTCLETG